MRRFPGGARLAQLWDALRTSYWFVPSLMAAGAVALSFASVHLDERVSYKWVRAVGWLWAGGAEGARQVLSTIAGSMITVAGVTFSITIVALTLASSQFGPRLLRNFVRDLGNQVVLGTFIATFTYCLLVLRTVRGEDGAEFVPYISVTLGVAFALADLGVLIYFIHHVATAIQADSLIVAVAGELEQAIDEMFPQELGEPPPAEAREPLPPPDRAGLAVAARRSGYVQVIDDGALMALAGTADLVLELRRGPGAFVVEGGELARLWPAGRAAGDAAERVRAAVLLGARRTPSQDPEYAVHQLVEIAVRALSPGINDPFTTMTCLDWLGAALSRVAGRRIPARHRYDEAGRLRVIAPGTDFSAMADAAFNQIRQYGRGSVSVLLRLLDTLAAVGEHVHRPGDRECLRRHARQVAAVLRVLAGPRPGG